MSARHVIVKLMPNCVTLTWPAVWLCDMPPAASDGHELAPAARGRHSGHSSPLYGPLWILSLSLGDIEIAPSASQSNSWTPKFCCTYPRAIIIIKSSPSACSARAVSSTSTVRVRYCTVYCTSTRTVLYFDDDRPPIYSGYTADCCRQGKQGLSNIDVAPISAPMHIYGNPYPVLVRYGSDF